jgi:3-isopropylmalate dehydratase small subunit
VSGGIGGRCVRFGDGVNTDVIIPGRYLVSIDPKELADHAFEPLGPEVQERLRAARVVVAGRNFGCGSAREQAASCLVGAGIVAVVAASFSRVFFRNAINTGLLAVECPEAAAAARDGDDVRVDVEGGVVQVGGERFAFPGYPESLRRILLAGGLIPFLKTSPPPQPSPARGEGASGQKTFAEKVLGGSVGEIRDVFPDLVMSHSASWRCIRALERLGRDELYDPDRIAMVMDRISPARTSKTAADHRLCREFATRKGIRRFHDVEAGIAHTVLMELGDIRPGHIVIGTDSHSTIYGALGAFGTGVGFSEVTATWVTGALWMRVPASLRVEIEGELPSGVTAKDLMLRLIGDLTADGATYLSVEFHGGHVRGLGVSERMTLCNLAMELGAKNAYVPPDDVTRAYLAERGVGPDGYREVHPDADAPYERVVRLGPGTDGLLPAHGRHGAAPARGGGKPGGPGLHRLLRERQVRRPGRGRRGAEGPARRPRRAADRDARVAGGGAADRRGRRLRRPARRGRADHQPGLRRVRRRRRRAGRRRGLLLDGQPQLPGPDGQL